MRLRSGKHARREGNETMTRVTAREASGAGLHPAAQVAPILPIPRACEPPKFRVRSFLRPRLLDQSTQQSTQQSPSCTPQTFRFTRQPRSPGEMQKTRTRVTTSSESTNTSRTRADPQPAHHTPQEGRDKAADMIDGGHVPATQRQTRRPVKAHALSFLSGVLRDLQPSACAQIIHELPEHPATHRSTLPDTAP